MPDIIMPGGGSGSGYVPGGTDVAVTDGGTGASTAAAARTNLDIVDVGVIPALGPTVMAPFDLFGGPLNGPSNPSANYAMGQRCLCQTTGTVTKISVLVGTSSGNIDVGVYSISGDDRTRIASSGSTAMSGTNAWQTITVSAAVTRGTYYDLVFAIDNGTGTIFRYDHSANASAAIAPPTGYPGAGSWARYAATTSFVLPASITTVTGKNQHQYSYAIMALIT